MKKKYRVTLELNVWGDSPEDAVKRMIDIMVEDNGILIYIVQDAETNKIYSVDQLEETFPAIEMEDYQPNIKTNIEL
jgi:hypothetical protein